MCGVGEMAVRFLESEDVKVVVVSKGCGTLRGVVKTLIPRGGTKEERRGGIAGAWCRGRSGWRRRRFLRD